MNNNRSKQKPPIYIKVYNEILKNIKEGLYSEQGKLPPENLLAKQMNVSRMTLRQSLNLLQEDGVIESRKGVGNFIKREGIEHQGGLEYIGDVLSKCGIGNIDSVVCKHRLDTAELYTNNIFQREVPVLLGVSLYYYDKNDYRANSFSIIPTDIPIIKDKNLADEKVIKDIVTKLIYEETKLAKYSLKVVNKENGIDKNLEKVKFHQFMLVTEELIGESGMVLCFNKYFIPTEFVEVSMNGYKK